MKKRTEHNIRCAVQYYRNGVTDKFTLAAKMKIHPQTMLKWSKTKLWKELVGVTTFAIPCRRKNLVAFNKLKRRYFQMKNIPEHHRLTILAKDPECPVNRYTLNAWRELWLNPPTYPTT